MWDTHVSCLIKWCDNNNSSSNIIDQPDKHYSNKHINWQWHWLHCSESAFSLIGKMEKLFIFLVAFYKTSFVQQILRTSLPQKNISKQGCSDANKWIHIASDSFITCQHVLAGSLWHYVLMYLIIIPIYITDLHDFRQFSMYTFQ